MFGFVNSFLSDPVWYIGLVLAFLGALAFLVFLRGFLSGTPHLFTLSGHDEHIAHHRVRITWGVWSLLILYIIWRVVVWLADLLTI